MDTQKPFDKAALESAFKKFHQTKKQGFIMALILESMALVAACAALGYAASKIISTLDKYL